MGGTTVKRVILPVVVGCVTLFAVPLWACSVPVYRYALERWWPDPYEVIVFHRGKLTEEQQSILKDLTPEGLAGEKQANVRMRTVDLGAIPAEEQLKKWRDQLEKWKEQGKTRQEQLKAQNEKPETQEKRPKAQDEQPKAQEKQPETQVEKPDIQEPQLEMWEAQLKMWKSQKTDILPWMIVKYPLATRNPQTVWAGSLSANVVKELLNSPFRQEVARLLLKGQSAVWVLLEGGDKKKNDAAHKLLKDRLAHLEKELAPPEVSKEDVAQGLIDIDPEQLKLSFATLRLSRTDPKEKFFVEMLLGSEEDLKKKEFNDQPMVFPIFGRGRALYALVGEGINQDNIDEGGFFLSGPCSCQVKQMNPGTDVLMAVDWESLLDPTIEIDESLPPLVGLAGFTVDASASKDAQEGSAKTKPGVESESKAETEPGGKPDAKAETTPEPKEVPDVPAQATATATAGHAEYGETSAVDAGISPLLRNVLLVAGIGVIGVVVASFLLISRRQP